MSYLDDPVAQIVLEHSECAAVFDRYRIDYCGKGNRSLRTVCEDRGLDPARVLAECETAMRARTGEEIDPARLSTKELIIKVIAPHHQYLHRTLPFLMGLSKKVARTHGDREPSLYEVANVFETLATTLVEHLDDEETIIFPALVKSPSVDPRTAFFLATMRSEHDEVGALLNDLRAAARNYICPDWACHRYRTLMAELAHLEADTLRHVHVENHALLPRFVPSA